jgi:hypothetical protein
MQKEKNSSQHGGNVVATNPYYMNPAGLIIQEKGTKRENSSELKQEQVWNHTDVRKGCADEDKKKKKKMPVKKIRQISWATKRTSRHKRSMQHARATEERQEEREEERDKGRGERHKQASLSSVW